MGQHDGHGPHGHDHHDDHTHEGDHAHGHDDGHAHAHGPRARADLTLRSGVGKTLFLDAPSGLAGDMIIAALVDLGVPESVVAGAVESLGMTGFHLHFGARERSGIVATSFDVHVEASQPERTYAAVRGLIDQASLSSAVRSKAHATFEKLAHSEAKVHRMALDDVHFHEVGAVDALVDVVGSAAALEWLGAELVVSPLPMGRGYVRARHGTLPLPAPATVECLAGFETYDAGADFEFVTPTGAAIVGAHARRSSRWPRMAPERVGWGAGTKDLIDRPNLLRAVLGRPGSAAEQPEAPYVVIEANVDDATGEIIGSAIETLLHEGALDAWATPVTMKKGRPGLVLSVLTTADRRDSLATAMLRETPSIGVRHHAVSRLERPRRTVEVETSFGRVPVKVVEGPFGPPQGKPEFDACLAIARAQRVAVRDVMRAAMTAWCALPVARP